MDVGINVLIIALILFFCIVYAAVKFSQWRDESAKKKNGSFYTTPSKPFFASANKAEKNGTDASGPETESEKELNERSEKESEEVLEEIPEEEPERAFEAEPEAESEEKSEEKPEEEAEEYKWVGLFVIKNRKLPCDRDFSIGEIVDFDGKYISVIFKGETVAHKYELPKSFENEALLFADLELQKAFNEGSLIWKKDGVLLKRTAKAEKPIIMQGEEENAISADTVLPIKVKINEMPVPEKIEPLWVNKNQPATMINALELYHSYESNAKILYQNGCNAFGWKKHLDQCFGQGTPMYAHHGDPNGDSIWCVTYHKWIGNDSKKWKNIVGKKYIHEYWYEAHLTEENKHNLFYDNSKRITFVRNLKKQYTFVGVYMPKMVSERQFDAQGAYWIKVYELVEKTYPYK